MKVFQVFNGFCYYDATSLYPNAEEAAKHYSPDTHFVDAPDYVFESWGFDEAKEGDERFIRPEAPEGWEYDEDTGTFRPILTPSQKRENAYNTEAIIDWGGGKITVTSAAQLWQYYAAEGNEKADELSALIREAKAKIREMYPDEESEGE